MQPFFRLYACVYIPLHKTAKDIASTEEVMAVSKILSVALFVSVYLVLVSGFGYGGIPGGIRRKYGGVIGGGFGAGKYYLICLYKILPGVAFLIHIHQ